jgi:hypothetical protein
VKFASDPLVVLARLQSLTRYGPPALTRRAERYAYGRAHSPGVSSPTALEVTGSDRHRGYLARLRCAFRLSQPLDAFIPPETVLVLFHTSGTLGVHPSEGFPPRRRRTSRCPLPLLVFLSMTARGGRPSPGRVRATARHRRRSEERFSMPRARAWSGPSAPSGVSARPGSPCFRRQGLAARREPILS